MLAIARGLMAKPRILLLDEPSLGLAPAMINELFDILAELRDDGVTILLVDQMAALALAVADRGYVLESGRIVRADTAAALADDPALEAAYLGRRRRRRSSDMSARSDPARRAHRRTRGRASSTSPSADGRIADDRAEHRRRCAGGTARRPAGAARLRRDAHPSRQVLHPGSLPHREHGHAAGGDRRGRRGQARLHRGGRLRARPAHAGEGDPAGHDAHAHPCRGRSAHRPQAASTRSGSSSRTMPGRSISRSACFRRKACSTIPAPRNCWSKPARRAPT